MGVISALRSAGLGHLEIYVESDTQFKFRSATRQWKYLLWRILLSLIDANKSQKKSISSFGWLKAADIAQHSIIVCGWISNNVISINELNKITRPVVIRVSDEWYHLPLVHYSCDRPIWKRGFRWLGGILERVDFEKKKQLSENSNITLVFPSEWLLHRYRTIFPDANVHCVVIRNSVDSYWSIGYCSSQERRYDVIFSASDLAEKRKRFADYLKIAEQCPELLFLAVGMPPKRFCLPRNMILEAHANRSKLKKLYCSSKIYIHLAELDNSPNSLLEAIACGCHPICMGGSGGEEYMNLVGANEWVLDKTVPTVHEAVASAVRDAHELLCSTVAYPPNEYAALLNAECSPSVIGAQFLRLVTEKLNKCNNES